MFTFRLYMQDLNLHQNKTIQVQRFKEADDLSRKKNESYNDMAIFIFYYINLSGLYILGSK